MTPLRRWSDDDDFSRAKWGGDGYGRDEEIEGGMGSVDEIDRGPVAESPIHKSARHLDSRSEHVEEFGAVRSDGLEGSDSDQGRGRQRQRQVDNRDGSAVGSPYSV